ncbi:hypothetical protein EWM64_g10277 [Hericium alpestre]|uniref:Uncharacterized protein n=1 Tax=Hericium alpestre TaxID=135208 RepID=A0A4Y9ZG71_9AGAM|nr:hypothetical protein EWM64_g10277 [Hericium alpestre]
MEKRKRPADDHGADADSDGHSSKRMRDGNRAPTRNGARASNNHAPVATRSVPSKNVPSTHAPAARPTAARPTTLLRTAPSENVPTSRAPVARPSTLPRPVPSESVPTTRSTTTRALSPRSPTRPRTAPSDRAPATRAPIARAPIARAPATHTPNPSHPASSKAVRSPDARHGVPLSKDVEKGAPSTEDAIKLQSEEKRSPPKEKVSSVEGEGVDLLMESVFMPELPSAFVDRLLRNIVQQAQDDNTIRSELLGRCQDILDEYPILDKEAKDRLLAAKASKEHGDLPWPFLRRVRAKVLYKAIDKETPLTDFEEACQEDLAKLFVRGSKPRTPTDDNPKLKI